MRSGNIPKLPPPFPLEQGVDVSELAGFCAEGPSKMRVGSDAHKEDSRRQDTPGE